MAGKKIIQIVGLQNSGKTTLIQALVKDLTEKGFAVGTIKHHGHGGTPERPIINKDSEKHRMAGAKVTSVEGAGTLHIEAKKDHWTLEEIIRFYDLLPIDIILVEGYKKMGFPKIVLLRDYQDEFLLRELTNIIALFSESPLAFSTTVPTFSKCETEQFIHWFMNRVNED